MMKRYMLRRSLRLMKTAELEERARAVVRVDESTHKLALQYKLVRPDVPKDNAISDLVEHLRKALPSCSVFAGQVEDAPARFLC